MKRCPECGFRANDTVCPLCGVKMRGCSAPIRSHNHTQPGEKCVLPNQSKPTVKQVPSGNGQPYRPDTTGTRRERNAKPNFGVVVFIIIMFILLRSCAWL